MFKSVFRKILYVLMTFIVPLIVIPFGQLAGYRFCRFIPDFFSRGAQAAASMYIIFLGIWIIILLIIVLFRHNRPMLRALTSRCRGNGLGDTLLYGTAFGFGGNMLVAAAALLIGSVSLSFDSLDWGGLILVFACVFIQSGAEELVCRVYIYQRLRRAFPRLPVLAIVGNSLLFALLHIHNRGVTPLALLNIFLFGLETSLMVYYLDSFWMPVLAHTMWNYTQNIILGLPNSGNISRFSVYTLTNARSSFAYDTAFGIEGCILASAVLALSCVIVVLIGRKRGGKPLDVWGTD